MKARHIHLLAECKADFRCQRLRLQRLWAYELYSTITKSGHPKTFQRPHSSRLAMHPRRGPSRNKPVASVHWQCACMCVCVLQLPPSAQPVRDFLKHVAGCDANLPLKHGYNMSHRRPSRHAARSKEHCKFGANGRISALCSELCVLTAPFTYWLWVTCSMHWDSACWLSSQRITCRRAHSLPSWQSPFRLLPRHASPPGCCQNGLLPPLSEAIRRLLESNSPTRRTRNLRQSTHATEQSRNL